MTVLDRSYFDRFYSADGLLSGMSEVSMLAGVIAAYFYFVLMQGSLKNGRLCLLKFYASAFIALHLLAMSHSGWLKVMEWPGRLPPISLLAFVATLGSVLFYWVASRRKREALECSIAPQA